MKKFVFLAADSEGKKTRGLVEASSNKEAVMILRKRGMFVIELTSSEKGLLHQIDALFGRINQAQIATFTRQLATMIESGLTLMSALALLAKQFKGKFGIIIGEILTDIEGGSTLTQSLSKYQRIFGSAYISSIRAGEEAGVLDKVLSRLADNLEKRKEFLGRVKSAMIYPIIVLAGMALVIVIVMVFVMPKMLSMYAEFGSKMPLPTRILLTTTSLMSRYFFVLPLIVVSLAVAYWALTKDKDIKEKFDRLWLKLPIMGRLSQTVTLSDVTQTLGTLVQTGVSLISGLDIVAQSTGNEVYRRVFSKAKDRVEKGFPFSEALEEEQMIPLIVTQMLGTGEETGKMDEVLYKISHYFQVEADERVKALTSAIEPLIIIVLGIGVGFLVFAVIMPIYNLTSQF